VETGAVTKVASDYFYGPKKFLRPTWSPYSKWIAYAINNQAYINRVYVYSLEIDKSSPVTDGLSDATDPVFDRGGKYLYFLSSTDAGPLNNWFSRETSGLKATRSIWLAVLSKDSPNPLVKESDEEKGPAATSEKEKDVVAKDEAGKTSTDKTDVKSDEKPKKPEAVAPVRIDFEGLAHRIIDVPVPVAEIHDLQAGPEEQIFFVRVADEKRALQRFDLKERKTETMLPAVAFAQESADRLALGIRKITTCGDALRRSHEFNQRWTA
jgi:tricorn protease